MSELRVPTRRFYGAPAWREDARYDVAFVGVPSDFGVLGHRSTAAGPAVVRGMSAAVYEAVAGDDGATIGWYSYARGRPILSGRRLADAGDYVFERGGGRGELAGLAEALRRVAATASVVVVVGGDHSLLAWTAQAYNRAAYAVLDAHEDATGASGPDPHHGNVMTFLERIDGPLAIAQHGLRGLVPNRRREPAAHRRMCHSIDEVVEHLMASGAEETVLSIDVDVLDPAVMSSVTSPSPNGYGWGQLLDAVDGIAAGGPPITLLDLAEFAPVGEEARVEAMGLAQFVLLACDSVLEARVGR